MVWIVISFGLKFKEQFFAAEKYYSIKFKMSSECDLTKVIPVEF